LAQIEIAAGKQEAALKHLDELLAQPSDRASPGYLRLSPQFDALRGNPEFEKLTAR